MSPRKHVTLQTCHPERSKGSRCGTGHDFHAERGAAEKPGRGKMPSLRAFASPREKSPSDEFVSSRAHSWGLCSWGHGPATIASAHSKQLADEDGARPGVGHRIARGAGRLPGRSSPGSRSHEWPLPLAGSRSSFAQVAGPVLEVELDDAVLEQANAGHDIVALDGEVADVVDPQLPGADALQDHPVLLGREQVFQGQRRRPSRPAGPRPAVGRRCRPRPA